MRQSGFAWRLLLCAMAMVIALLPMTAAIAEEDTRWADAADEIRERFCGDAFDLCAIVNAKNSDYQLVDVEKMERLYQVVTGERSTPTPHIDLTMIYDIEQQSTQSAITLAGGTAEPADKPSNEGGNENTSGGSVSSGPQADSDPFGTGIRITTDPNALPMLDLPAAPTITPNPDALAPSHAGTQVSTIIDTEGFTGIPDDVFGGN